MALPVFDHNRLASFVSEKRRRSRLTLRQAAEQIGVSAATLWRVEQASGMPASDTATVRKISDWLKVPPGSFLVSSEKPESNVDDGTNHTLANVEALLRADRKLSPETAKALSDLIRAAYAQLSRGT